MSTDDYKLLTDLLKQRGHSEAEIKKILVRVRQYEQQTQLDSVMDSIGNGRLNLQGLIEEALSEQS